MNKININMSLPKVSLDQWIIFQTIVQTGSYLNAANKLHKSQSSIGYNMTKMQELIGIKLFDIKGRKAILTQSGKLILKRSESIVSQLSHLENSIAHYKNTTEHQFTILIDELFPIDLLAILLKKFETVYPSIHVMLLNQRAAITEEELMEKGADCAITRNKVHKSSVEILTLECYPYAHPDYLMSNDNSKKMHYRQITHKAFDKSKTNNSHSHCCQWEVDSLTLMIELIASKQGYGYLPALHADKSTFNLKRLDLQNSPSLNQYLYISHLDPDLISEPQKSFFEIIKNILQ